MSGIWPKVAPYVRRAIERGNGTFGDTAHDVLNGKALLWLAWSDSVDAVAVTKLFIEDNVKVCLLVACSAVKPYASWKHLLSELEAYAKFHGCSVFRIQGRRGWKRRLPDYREPYIVLEKELI